MGSPRRSFVRKPPRFGVVTHGFFLCLGAGRGRSTFCSVATTLKACGRFSWHTFSLTLLRHSSPEEDEKAVVKETASSCCCCCCSTCTRSSSITGDRLHNLNPPSLLLYSSLLLLMGLSPQEALLCQMIRVLCVCVCVCVCCVCYVLCVLCVYCVCLTNL